MPLQERLRDLVDSHPRAVAAGVIGGALVLSLAAVGLAIAVFGGARPTADASPIPSASVRPSSLPTAEPSPSSSSAESTTPTSTPSASSALFTDFEYATILRVEVNGLAVRQSPTLTSPLVQGSRFDGTNFVPTGDVRLNTGDFVSVELGSLPMGDIAWYLVWPAEDARLHYMPTLSWEGWVAASVGEDQYLSWYRPPDPADNAWGVGGPQTLMQSGTGDYESEPQGQHDLFAFHWAVAADEQPSPCAFSVTLRPEDGAPPVTAVETSTSAFEQGPTEGPRSVLNPPWPATAETSSATFRVSIRSGCTWTIGLWPLGHD